MEIITVQYRDGTDQTFESEGDLSETWTTLCDEPNVLYARYRVPARYTPSGTRTYGTIGISRGEAARIEAEREHGSRNTGFISAQVQEARIAARTWEYNGHRDSLSGR